MSNRLSVNQLIWAVALTVTLGVPGSIVAWRWTEPPVTPPSPSPAPVTFGTQLAAAVKPLPTQQRLYLTEQFLTLQAVCQLSKQPASDGDWQRLIQEARLVVYGETQPYAADLTAVNELIRAECEKRKLTLASGEAVPWDKAAWSAFAAECLEAIR